MVDASRTLSRCWHVVQVIVNSSTICRLVPGCRDNATGADQVNRCLARFYGFPMFAPAEKNAGRDPAMLILSPET